MEELEELFKERLISHYMWLDKMQKVHDAFEEDVCEFEKLIVDMFGEEKAVEMYEEYKRRQAKS